MATKVEMTKDYNEEIMSSLRNDTPVSPTVGTPTTKANFISRRLVDKPFKNEAEAKWWLRNSPACTEFLHALSILFPEGEAFFVRAVAKVSKDPKITAHPILSADVKAFISQEAQHAGEHSSYNREIGKKYGHDQEKMTQLVKWVLSLPERFPLVSDPTMICLGITCSLEHLTAILAELLLCTDNGAATICSMQPSHRYLWVWHAIEETEHKAVAFDVYQKMGANYFARCLRHIISTVIFIIVLTYVHAVYMYDAGVLFSISSHAEFQYFLWVYPGVLRMLIPMWLQYFHPSFHPWGFRHNLSTLPEWNKRIQDHSLTDLTLEECCKKKM